MKNLSIFVRLDHIWSIMTKFPFTKLLLLLFAISFLVHGFVVAIFIKQPIALDDMFQYDMLARSLSNGSGFRWYAKSDVEILRPYYSQFLDLDQLEFPEQGLLTTFRAPGYPFFLAFLYLLVPKAGHFVIARLVQAGLAAMLAPLTAILGKQAGFSRKECIITALGTSFYPILLFYPVGLASENLYILLGLLSVILIYQSTKKKSWGWILLAGIVCGMTMFTRSVFAIFTLLAGGWITHFNPRHRKAGLFFLLIAFGICMPWSIRNSLILQKPAFVEGSAGYNMFIGYHPQGDGGFISRIAIIPMSILDDGERDQFCTQQAIHFILQNPCESLYRVWVRLTKFLGPEDQEFFFFYSNNFLGAISQPWITLIYLCLLIPWALTLFLGIIGLWQKRTESLTSLIVFFLLGYCLPHLLIIAEPRFHLAWVLILMPNSVFGWNSIRKIQKKDILKTNHAILIFILIIATIIFASGFIMDFPKLFSILSEGGNQLHFSY